VTCREFAEFIGDYLSRELSSDVVAQFERHLSGCTNCHAYLANYRTTVDLGRQAFAADEADLPADVPDDLVEAILASRRGQS
jgi:anti-sigma factor RsiW